MSTKADRPNELNVDTAGGLYIHGNVYAQNDFVGHDKITINVTINGIPYGIGEPGIRLSEYRRIVDTAIEKIKHSMDTMPLSTLEPVITPIPLPSRSPASTNTRYFEIEQHHFFKDLKQIWVGETLIVPVLLNKFAPIKVFTRGNYRTARVQLDISGELTVWSWYPDKLIKTTISRHDDNWPSPKHFWQFNRLDLEQELRLSNDVVILFDRNIIKVAWQLCHKAKDKVPETFLVLLGEDTKR